MLSESYQPYKNQLNSYSYQILIAQINAIYFARQKLYSAKTLKNRIEIDINLMALLFLIHRVTN